MIYDRLFGFAMIHIHLNDTIGKVNPESVIKRWDSNGKRKIHLAFTDYNLLSFQIIQYSIILKSIVCVVFNLPHKRVNNIKINKRAYSLASLRHNYRKGSVGFDPDPPYTKTSNDGPPNPDSTSIYDPGLVECSRRSSGITVMGSSHNQD